MIDVQLLTSPSRSQQISSLLRELSPDTEPITQRDLEEFLSTRNCFIFVALDFDKDYPDNLVGMATIFFVWRCSGWLAEIHDMVVYPEYRGRHIGDMLMKKLLEVAKTFAEEESKKITISLTSKPHRVAANNMYLKHGFKLVAKAEGEEGTNLYKIVIESSE